MSIARFCATICRSCSPAPNSPSRPATSRRRFSTSACPRRSTCRSSAATSAANMAYATACWRRDAPHPGHRGRAHRADACAQPTLLVSAHRSLRARRPALTESDIADNTLTTLSGSGRWSPTYWLDHKTGVAHLVNLQTPQTQLTSMSDLETIPIDKGDGDPNGQGAQILGGLRRSRRSATLGGVASRHHAGDRHLREHRGTRSGRRERCGRAVLERTRGDAAATRRHRLDAGPGGDDEERLCAAPGRPRRSRSCWSTW